MNELLVGYARVSTEQQDLPCQRNGLHALGVGDDRIYVDHGLTGTNRDHWDYFTEAGMPRWQQRLAQVREELCTGGRTLVQGALAYVWARSGRAVALGGIRTPEQAMEQAGALAYGPLT